MDASRLLAVVNDIESEYRGGFFDLLAVLIQQYTAARDTPTQDNTPAIQEALRSLVEDVAKGAFTEYPPSKAAVLEAVGGIRRVGPGFQERLNEILSVTGQTTAGIVTGLGELQADLQKFQKACVNTKSGLQSLGVTPYTLQPGAFEAGILIPEELVDRRLGALAKELEDWNKIVRGFQEIAGEDEREVIVAGLASGSYEVYIPLGIAAATLLAKTIDKVLEWYRQILEIRKLRLEMEKLRAPVAETETIKKHEHDQLAKNILALATELVNEAHPTVTGHRKQELETQIKFSIRQIARFVDKGGIVEVYAEPPDEPKELPAQPEGEEATPEAAQNRERLQTEYTRLKLDYEKVSRIREAGSSLRRLPERSEPILQLTDGEPDDEPPQPEKPGKKKS